MNNNNVISSKELRNKKIIERIPVHCWDCFLKENKWVVASKIWSRGMFETWSYLCQKHFQEAEYRWILWRFEKEGKWAELGYESN